MLVEYFGHRQVNGAGAADDAFIAGEGQQRVVAGDVADGQQGEQQRQAGEHELQHAVGAQGAEEHEQGEDAPQRQVDAQHVGLGGLCQAQARQQQQADQTQPEAAVGGEGGHAEGVALLVLQQSGQDLGQATEENPHADDGGVQWEKARVVQVQQDGSHPEAHQAERAGIRQLVGVHKSSAITEN